MFFKVSRHKLLARDTMTIPQPNCRFAYREYFRDYTRIAVCSHVSITDFLTANGYEVLSLVPRFMPLIVRSRMPVWPCLVAGYLVDAGQTAGQADARLREATSIDR